MLQGLPGRSPRDAGHVFGNIAKTWSRLEMLATVAVTKRREIEGWAGR